MSRSLTAQDLTHSARHGITRAAPVTVIKWLASIFQIMGYAATGFGLAPWNIYLFLLGLIGWFVVGLLWKDRAVILIHVIAFGSMVAGIFAA